MRKESYCYQNIHEMRNVRKLYINFSFHHGIIVRTGITCNKIPLKKSIEFSMALR